MAWNESDFMANVIPMERRYKNDNKWWYKPTSPPWKDEACHGWLLYERANENELGKLVLGDAKIRTSGDLLSNFGLASGGGLWDQQSIQQARDIQDWRDGVAKGTSQPSAKVLGPGSILNDKDWTPMLNDAFILGGVHGAQPFFWAEAGFEEHTTLSARDFAQRREAAGPAAPQYASIVNRDAAYFRERWRLYLRKHSNFWAEGIVRIFARELIGLKTFGYEADFTAAGVVFEPVGDGASATFEGYLEALNKVEFENGNVALINGAIGEFLFGDRNSLSDLITGSIAPGPGMLHPPKSRSPLG